MLSSNISYEVSRTRINDLRSEAGDRRRARTERDDSSRAARAAQRQRPSRQSRRALRVLTLRRA
jgi:hypothetical protein